MKQITLKTIVLIDGIEVDVRTADFSQSVADLEKDLDCPMSDEDIVNHVFEDCR